MKDVVRTGSRLSGSTAPDFVCSQSVWSIRISSGRRREALEIRLSHAQLMALVEGLDWKRVRAVDVRAPQSAG